MAETSRPGGSKSKGSKATVFQNAPLLRLPPELLVCIVDSLIASWRELTNYYGRRPDYIVPLTLVCKALRDVAQPILLSRVIVDEPTQLEGATAWAQRQRHLGRAGILHLSVGTVRAGPGHRGTRSSISEIALADLLQECPRLQTLDICIFSNSTFWQFTPELIKALHGLEHLERLQYGTYAMSVQHGWGPAAVEDDPDPALEHLLSCFDGHSYLKTLVIDAEPPCIDGTVPVFPNLSHAVIRYGTDPWLLESQPNLRFLDFQKPYPNKEAAVRVLSCLAPRLEGLALGPDIAGFHRIPFPRLKTFTVIPNPHILSDNHFRSTDLPLYCAAVDTFCVRYALRDHAPGSLYRGVTQMLKWMPQMRNLIVCVFDAPAGLQSVVPPWFRTLAEEQSIVLRICPFSMIDMEAWTDREELLPFGDPDSWYLKKSNPYRY